MSSHTFSQKIDQKEYLKKYISGDKHKKKKKKDKSHEGKRKVRVIDDDAHVPDQDQYIDEELLLTGDDAPQIVGEYIEEKSNGDKKAKWRSIGVKEENDDYRNVKREPEDLWGKRASDIKLERNYSPERRKHPNKIKEETPDMSPPRRRRKGSESMSPPRRRRNGSVGMSPPRRRRNSSNDLSPPRKKPTNNSSISPRRRDYNAREDKSRAYAFKQERRSPDEDLSPPRRGRKPFNDGFSQRTDEPPSYRKNSRDFSPPRRRNFSPKNNRNNSNDLSPGRRNYQKNSNNYGNNRRRESPSFSRNRQSPPSGSNHRNPFKQSPKRDFNDIPKNDRHLEAKPSRWNRSSSPKRPKPQEFSKNRFNSDQSPPRRNQNHLSPRRGHDGNPFRKNSNPSPPRKDFARKRSLSPVPRKRDQRSEDWSPPKRNSPNRYQERLKPRASRSPPPRSKTRSSRSPPPRSKARWSRSPPPYRSKGKPSRSPSPPPTHKPKHSRTLDGKKAGLQDAHSLRLENEERRRQEERSYEKMSREMSGRDAEVNVRSTGRKGRRARMAEDEDPEIRRLKEEREKLKKDLYDRWGKGLKQVEDHKNRRAEQEHESNKPLARYRDDEDLERHLREKEHPDDPMLAYMREKRKEKERAENKPVIPIYEGPYPENRFGIRPGYRWDGVDRSNGYEQKWLSVQNERKAIQDEAYKYSVEDM